MKKISSLLLLLFLFALYNQLLAQRDGPPRRIENPETIQLSGGSRVEFRSFSSSSLGQEAEYSVLIPARYDQETRNYPVIYFLHGMFNDHTSWATERYGLIPAQIEKLMVDGKIPPSLVVIPDAGNSFYTNSIDGTGRYEDFICQDIIQEIERNFRVSSARENRSVGGVSMGGYGALKIALKRPLEFGSTVGISPIVLLGDNPSEGLNHADQRRANFFVSLFKPVFGIPFQKEHWKENSLEQLAQVTDPKGLNIFFAYGTNDRYNNLFPLEKGVQRLHALLEERRIPHRFEAYQGEPHGWELVTNHLEEVMLFLSQTFSAD